MINFSKIYNQERLNRIEINRIESIRNKLEGKFEGKIEGRIEGRAEGRSEERDRIFLNLIIEGIPIEKAKMLVYPD